MYCQQFQFNRVVAIIVRLPTGGAATALYSSRIRCPEPELSGHLQHTVLVARRWRRRRRGHGKVLVAALPEPLKQLMLVRPCRTAL